MTDDIAPASPASDIPSPTDGYVGDPAVRAEWDNRYADRQQEPPRPTAAAGAERLADQTLERN
ncbi:hypothetical protein [Streptomyces hawaiiensis]|uniref:hypothetical protein n=1 Tax=Streptomyces hawaiiensis TaxID=67305 RepID=UPI001FE65C74|nr:hypothetical protein [Streptomyces hawaiiensis]